MLRMRMLRFRFRFRGQGGSRIYAAGSEVQGVEFRDLGCAKGHCTPRPTASGLRTRFRKKGGGDCQDYGPFVSPR